MIGMILPFRTDHDLADIVYAAALYEGEGTIVASKTSFPGGWHRISIRMTDAEPLARMHRIFGGHFYGPYNHICDKPGYKPKYEWSLQAWRDIIPFCKLVYPYLSPRRRRQMDVVLSRAPELPRGVTNCPSEPVASSSGYYRHINRGEEPCEVCRKSLYLVQKKGWKGRTDLPLICPSVPFASYAGYNRHNQLGDPPCDICLKSARMYDHNRRTRKRQANPPKPRELKPCPTVVTASCAGYQLHRKRGTPACEVCLKSVALYQTERNRRKRHSSSESESDLTRISRDPAPGPK